MDNDFFKKINRFYLDIKEIYDDHEKLNEYFQFDISYYKEITNLVRISKDQGYIEARESQIIKIKAILDDAKYQVISKEKIALLIDYCNKILFLTLITRKIFLGELINDNAIKKSLDEIKKIDLKAIVSDIAILSQENKELSENRSFKEISYQLQKYNEELKKIGELVKTISPEKKKQFLQNANVDLSEILNSIKKNYKNILDYMSEKKFKEKNQENLLLKLSLKKMIPLYAEQITNFSKLRAAFIYIRDERYNFQEVVEKMYTKLDENISLLHKEEKMLVELLINNKIDSNLIDSLIISITDMIIKIIEKNYLK